MYSPNPQDPIDYAATWKEVATASAPETAAQEPDEFIQLAENRFKGDGVMTTQGHQRYLEATGEYIDGSKPEAKPEKPLYSHGKDDRITEEYKARTKDAKRNDGVEKLMKMHGITRERAEKMIP